MIAAAVGTWLQAPTPILTDTQTRFVLWVVAGLVTIIGGILTLGGQHLFQKMDDDARERKALGVTVADQATEVARKVETVREDHRAEIQRVYERVELSNGRTSKSLAEMEVKIGRIETIIDERLPLRKSQRRASA